MWISSGSWAKTLMLKHLSSSYVRLKSVIFIFKPVSSFWAEKVKKKRKVGGKQRRLWNKHFSSISESTVHMSAKVMVNSGKGLKQDLSGKLRTIRVGVFKMHAHAYVSTHLLFFLILFCLSHTHTQTHTYTFWPFRFFV